MNRVLKKPRLKPRKYGCPRRTMPSAIARRIASELALNEPHVAAVAALLAEGATIPFIARLPQGGHGQPGRGGRRCHPRPDGRTPSVAGHACAPPSSNRWKPTAT
ncbi:MAG: hypothetical protein MZV70_37610 [Desulfobacterales bacterium]|nr:hypothetical protein [Desulfobacterales bacterium]